MIFVKESLQAIQEVYVGATKDILELENLIGNIRRDYEVEQGQLKNFNLFSSVVRDKRWLDVQNKMCDIWGFADCSVNVYLSEYSNAYTYPVTYSMDVEPEKMIVRGPNGYKYSKISNFYTMFYISSALLCNKEYSDKEVMAVLLHEVGHSFSACTKNKCDLVQSGRDSAVFYYITCMVRYADPSYAVALVQNTNMYKKVMTALNNRSKDGKSLYVYNSDFITNVTRILTFPLKILFTPLLNKIAASDWAKWISAKSKDQKYMKNLADARTDEYLSDSFAVMYGYGQYQVTGLTKMYNESDAYEDFCKKVPIVGKLMQTSEYSYWVLAETFSVHPSLPARIDNITKELDAELKKSNLPPKMKKQIQENIKDLEEFRKSVKELTISDDDPNKFKKEWIKKMIELSKNPDVENKFEDALMNQKDRDAYYNDLQVEKESASFFDQINFL